MPNMAYCRFQNTLSDLNDCYDHIEDNLSPEEHTARLDLVEICKEIVRAEKNHRIPVGDNDTPI